MDMLASLLGRNGFLPHGYCFTWQPALLWTLVGADAVIAAAYFSIPVALLSFMRRRGDVSIRGVVWLFCAFIFACGVTHVMDIWTIWRPDYGPQALSKVVTAGVSLVTAVAVWPLIPKALKLPTLRHLQNAVDSLQAEVARRRSAEEQLAEIQQSLAVTLSSIGAGFIAADRQGRITRLNSVAERVLGWTEAAAMGRSYWHVVTTEDRTPGTEARNPIDLMIERGITVNDVHHLVLVARDGTRTPTEMKAALTQADGGGVRGMVLVFRDLSDITRAEAEAGRMAAIVESSGDAIIGKTLDGRITSWNPAAGRMFGYAPEEAIGQPVQMLIPAEREAEEMRILADLARGLSVPPFDTARRTKDGRVLRVSLSISPIRDARGRIVGASKIVRDVTRERQAEADLRESEARLRFTLASAQIGDWDLDLATGMVSRSALHDRCFGYEQPLPLWTFEMLVAHVHPEDRVELQRQFASAVREFGEWGFECRVVWPDDSVHWVSLHGSLRQEDGRATHMLGIVSDITQKRQADEARLTAQRLETVNRQIQEASRLKSLFLANMSHELRTPLNAVIGFADLLRSGSVSPQSPKHGEYLGHIGNSGRHLLQLINDVLDLSKVESGKFEFHPEPLDLEVLVKQSLDVLHTAIVRKRIDVETEIAPGLDDIVLDAGRLKQALYNYVSNAIKFTPEGGRVTVRVRPEGRDFFRLEVQDNGIGIAAADLPLLFTEFQQLDASYSKQHQGTGLGLALTRRLVEAQGGSIGVRSEPGLGSIFHLILPRVHGSASTAELPSPSGRLLVMEADAAGQARLVGALRDAGFEVDAVATGAQAMQRAQDHVYSALTLDLMLPDEGGLRALERIRDQGSSRAPPVRSVTISAAPGQQARFAITDVLSKPIRTGEVVGAIARLRAGRPQGMRVLVIDDDPLALDLMKATLSVLGSITTGVLDSRQALQDIEFHRPDAIVLDLIMPGFDGFAVLDALRSMPAWRETPVFIWTSMILHDDELASLARSATAIVHKGGGALDAVLDGLRQARPLEPNGVHDG